MLEQSDGTAWMAMYCQDLLEMALALSSHDSVYEDLATKFFEHFALIGSALNDKGLWDEQDGFYYDVLRTGGDAIPLRARSVVGLLPLAAATTIGPETMAALPDFAARVEWFVENLPLGKVVSHMESPAHAGWRMLSIVNEAQLRRLLGAMLDPDEFLSDHGLRGLSRRHLRQPLTIEVGGVTDTLDYEPAESRTGLFGGNSNWRGPVWFPHQLPAHRDAARLPPLPGRRLHRRVPHRRRRRAHPGRGRRRAGRPPHRHLPQGA